VIVGSSQVQTYFLNSLPGYDIVKARIGLMGDAWSSFLFVDNLTNKQAFLNDTNNYFSDIPSLNRVATNQPRTVGLTFELHDNGGKSRHKSFMPQLGRHLFDRFVQRIDQGVALLASQGERRRHDVEMAEGANQQALCLALLRNPPRTCWRPPAPPLGWFCPPRTPRTS